jgi:hypothetical protein
MAECNEDAEALGLGQDLGRVPGADAKPPAELLDAQRLALLGRGDRAERLAEAPQARCGPLRVVDEPLDRAQVETVLL